MNKPTGMFEHLMKTTTWMKGINVNPIDTKAIPIERKQITGHQFLNTQTRIGVFNTLIGERVQVMDCDQEQFDEYGSIIPFPPVGTKGTIVSHTIDQDGDVDVVFDDYDCSHYDYRWCTNVRMVMILL